MSCSPPTHTSRRSRAASATGTGALSPSRSQGAANARGSPAITAISSTGSPGVSRYTAPECACTSSMSVARVRESNGRPTGSGAARDGGPDACQWDTPTTSTLGHAKEPRDQGSPVGAVPARRGCPGARCTTAPVAGAPSAGSARRSTQRDPCRRYPRQAPETLRDAAEGPTGGASWTSGRRAAPLRDVHRGCAHVPEAL